MLGNPALLVLTSLCVLIGTPATAQSVQVDDGIRVLHWNGDEGTLLLSVSQGPIPGETRIDFTGAFAFFYHDLNGLELTLEGFEGIFLDEGSDWYFVHAGDPFGPNSGSVSPYPLIVGYLDESLSTLDTNSVSFSPLLDFANGLEDGPEDFYLAVATSSSLSGSGPRDIFGWVKLGVEPTGFNDFRVVQLESALAFGSQGIIVGTFQTIPEPSTGLLVGGILLLFSRRNLQIGL